MPCQLDVLGDTARLRRKLASCRQTFWLRVAQPFLAVLVLVLVGQAILPAAGFPAGVFGDEK